MAKLLKKRKWIFILYPESMPDNYLDIIQETGLEGCISPLHDRDMDIVDGEPTQKKPHYHVLVKYDGPTTKNVVMQLTNALNALQPVPCESIRGQYRYFTHQDNPEKAQYDKKEMYHFGGFDIKDYVDMTKTEITKIKKELHAYIRHSNVQEYSSFMNYLADNDDTDHYEVGCSNTHFFDKLITSQRNVQKAKANIRASEIRKELHTTSCLLMELDVLEDAVPIKTLKKRYKYLTRELKQIEE